MGIGLSLSKPATSFALDFWEIALAIFTLVVVVGLWGEYDERWKPWIVIFELLVIVGVAGEMFADAGIFLFSRHLQTLADVEIAQLNNKTERLKAETTQKEERLTDEAWLLGNIFMPRRVPVSMGPNGPSGEAFGKLQKFPGTKVAVVSAPDLEAIQLAADIAGALHEAGWNNGKNPFVRILPMDQAYSLIGVHVSTETQPPARLSQAVEALSAYLEGGFLRDLNLEPTATSGIHVRSANVPPNTAGFPTLRWWPAGFVQPGGTVCVFVGIKDFESQLDNTKWFLDLPEGPRKFFLYHRVPVDQ